MWWAESVLERDYSKYRERSTGSVMRWICERMFNIEKKFWEELFQLEKNNDNENFKECLVKVMIRLEKDSENYYGKKKVVAQFIRGNCN